MKAILKNLSNHMDMEKSTKTGKNFYRRNFLWINLLVCFLLCVSITYIQYSILRIDPLRATVLLELEPEHIDSCSGRYIYMYELPSKFNSDIIKKCSSLNKWLNMCPYVSNMGLGRLASNSNGVLRKKSWYSTNQFSLEIIFHEKMRKYKCLTNNSLLASAIFVPYYAGLDISRYLWDGNNSERDAVSLGLKKWLVSQPEWKYLYGRDHFFITGRISWDFRRQTGINDTDWGNRLLLLPETKNMTVLTIERKLGEENEFAIPYPTYFHPSNKEEVLKWRKKVLRQRRRNLFTFLGARRPNLENSIRDQIIVQCLNASEKCSFIDCSNGTVNCNEPGPVMKMFMNSNFCLQPPGDSFTRRSTFDSILAGCIPVFFHPGSAYEQYKWHFSKNYTKYSVFISKDSIRNGEANVEKLLLEISKVQVLEMRKEVTRLIPKILYSNPRFRSGTGFEDAFDIAVKKVVERVNGIRKEMKGNGTKCYV